MSTLPRAALSLLLTLVSLHNVSASERDYPIRPVPLTDVEIADAFWTPRFKTNREVTVRYDFRKCEETGRIDNFAVAGGLKTGGFQGIFFNDSDVFKVVEGAAYCLAQQPDDELDRYLDELIAKFAAAQEDDGYLYTARTIGDPKYNFPGREARWSHLASGHELYNVGHLYEAAVAHFRATGKRTLLDIAIKNADLVCKTFGAGPDQLLDVPGHQEIEIGLVKLYRVTGDDKYLRQAKFFIDARGRSDRQTYGPYCQDHRPMIQQDEAVGHAVRAGYLYAGVADVAALTGDESYVRAIDRIWQNIVQKKMYLTGGVGSSRHGEAFGENYQLPNATAYNETCAAIAQALFNHRMFLLHGDAKYVDVLERIIYNGFLSGISLSGDRFFYPNPLACNGHTRFNQGQLGRSPWFGCSCCPVNVVRFIPSIAGYVYATRADNVYVNLYVGGSGNVTMGDTQVKLKQTTQYPWEGKVRIDVEMDKSSEFALHVRIPGWLTGRPLPSDLYRYTQQTAEKPLIRINGIQVDGNVSRGYAVLQREWKSGDTIELEFPMTIKTVIAHEKVQANRDRMAIERGPIVYCLEAVDNDGAVANLVLSDVGSLRVEPRSDLFGGINVITGRAQRARRLDDGSIDLTDARMMAVPYYAWAHRKLGEMEVWLARKPEAARIKAAPTIASRSRATASHVWQSDSVDAVKDQLEPTSSGDHSIPRHTWWDHRGTREWLQLDFDRPQEVRQVDVYWFDDTGQGYCRVPQSWSLQYRDGDEWKAVQPTGPYTTSRDSFNQVKFNPIATTGLRLDVQLQPEFSGGVLEWRVK